MKRHKQKNYILKIITLVLIQAFLMLDVAWCGENVSTLAPEISMDTRLLRRVFYKQLAQIAELNGNYSTEGNFTRTERDALLAAMKAKGAKYIMITDINTKDSTCKISVVENGKEIGHSLGSEKNDQALAHKVSAARARLYKYSAQEIKMPATMFVILNLPAKINVALKNTQVECDFGITKRGNIALKMKDGKIKQARGVRVKNIAIISAKVLQNKVALYTALAHLTNILRDSAAGLSNLEQQQEGLSRELRILGAGYKAQKFEETAYRRERRRIDDGINNLVAQIMIEMTEREEELEETGDDKDEFEELRLMPEDSPVPLAKDDGPVQLDVVKDDLSSLNETLIGQAI